ncbi:MAG: metallophosphoesterase family protein [Cellulosilyticaceae bacterium]
MRVGIISDTHGVLNPQVVHWLGDCEAILHAGDVGAKEVLDELKKIAPVYVVKGNNDTAEWAKELPERLVVTLADYKIFIVHDSKECNGSKEYDIVVSGHSHKLKISQEGRQLYINPGACGKKRFNLPLTIVKMDLDENQQLSIHYL